MASKFHGGNKTKERMVAFNYATYVAPNLMASFALTLYDKTDMSVDDMRACWWMCRSSGTDPQKRDGISSRIAKSFLASMSGIGYKKKSTSRRATSLQRRANR